MTQYEGGYTDYLEAKTRRRASAVSADGTGDAGAAGRSRQKGGPVQNGSLPDDASENGRKSGKSWKQDQPQKLKFSYKEQREYETIDDDIAAIEAKLETIGRQIEANATNSVKLKELLEEQEKTQGELDEKMERWVYLNDLAEKIAEQE